MVVDAPFASALWPLMPPPPLNDARSAPCGGSTRSEDLVDLRRHEAEFERRLAFAYSLVPTADLDGEIAGEVAGEVARRMPRTLGCVYINPATRRGFDAEVA